MAKKICYLFVGLLAIVITSAEAAKTPKTHKKHTKVVSEKPAPISEPTIPIYTAIASLGKFIGIFDITSNYIFRGISESSNLPAFQGGLTYRFNKTGIYFSLWGSNVNFSNSMEIATVEIDDVVGIAKSFNDTTSFDLHFVRYNYPKATSFQYNEVVGSLTYRYLTFLVGYTNNLFNTGHDGTYYNLSVNVPLPEKVIHFENISFLAGVGRYVIDSQAAHSYNDYSIAINKTIKNYILALQWTDTNHRLLHNSLDSAKIIGTVTVNF